MRHALRLAFALVVLVLAGASSGGAPIPKDAGRPGSEYYPLVKGTTWVYKIGDFENTVHVAGTERLGKEECVRVETWASPEEKVSELYAVRADGIYRVKVKDEVLEQPYKVLPLPIKKDATWAVDTKLGTQTVKGTMTVKEVREKVKTAAGEFEAVLIESSDLEVGGTKMQMRLWFAKGFGIVNQEFTLGEGKTITLELSKFTPGEVAPKP